MAQIDQLQADVDELLRRVDLLENANPSDINKLRQYLNTHYYDLSEVDDSFNKVDDDLTGLTENLTGLEDSLTEFNDELIEFEGDLTDFGVELGNFGGELSGYSTILDNIQTAMYGGEGYDIDHPSPNSLKGQLKTFGEELADLSRGDTKLALTLSTLTGYLVSFKGTLAEFRQKIIDDLGQSVYDGLDEEIIKLIGAVTSANQDIEDHQDLIDTVQTTIGSSTDSQSQGDNTLYGILNDTSDLADETSTLTGQVKNTVDNTITPSVNKLKNEDIPQINGILNGDGTEQGLIDKVGDTIETIGDTSTQGTILYDLNEAHLNIGNVNRVRDGTLQNQIVNTNDVIGNPSDFTGTDISSALGGTQSTASRAENKADGAGIVANRAEGKADANSQAIGDTSDFTGTDISSALGGTQSTASDASIVANRAEGKADDNSQAIGNTSQFSGTDISSALGTAQTDITSHNNKLVNLNNLLAQLLDPSSNVTYCAIVDFINDFDNAVNYIKETWNIDCEYIYCQGTYYKKINGIWSGGTLPASLYPIGIDNKYGYLDPSTNISKIKYVYEPETKKYFTYVRKQTPQGFWTYEWEEAKELDIYFEQIRLCEEITKHYNLLLSHDVSISLDTGTGSVNLSKYGKQVICDFNFYYTPTSKTYTNVFTIPSEYVPSTVYQSDSNKPVTTTIDVSTGSLRHCEVSIQYNNPSWKLTVYNFANNVTNIVRGQLTWFTD